MGFLHTFTNFQLFAGEEAIETLERLLPKIGGKIGLFQLFAGEEAIETIHPELGETRSRCVLSTVRW